LPLLPPSLRELFCQGNQLTTLPPLPRALKNLSCQYNQLTRLPPLSPFLRVLHCENNLLTQLPLLPISLKDLYCKNNQLTCFPTMMVEKVIQHLEIISYYGNPFSNIIERHDSSFIENNYEYNYDIFITLYNSNLWNRFRFFYFLSKFRKKFLSWMWKSREKKIKERYHPKHLFAFIDNGFKDADNGLDDFLNAW
jgi:hypothetical protein